MLIDLEAERGGGADEWKRSVKWYDVQLLGAPETWREDEIRQYWFHIGIYRPFVVNVRKANNILEVSFDGDRFAPLSDLLRTFPGSRWAELDLPEDPK